MKNVRQPVSFIATDQPEAALAFYGDTLGLELREATPFALVFSDHAQVLRVQIISDLNPANHTVHGWQVANIVDEMTALVAKGVQFQRFAQLDQDELGIWTTPDGNKIAWFKDPSGNILSLSEHI